MNKKDLIESLEGYDDDTEIVLWVWNGVRSVFTHLNQILTNIPEDGLLKHPSYFGLTDSECTFYPKEQ